jgi:hypothetical protein
MDSRFDLCEEVDTTSKKAMDHVIFKPFTAIIFRLTLRIRRANIVTEVLTSGHIQDELELQDSLRYARAGQT